jgi:glucose/arabinose dehydrogenase
MRLTRPLALALGIIVALLSAVALAQSPNAIFLPQLARPGVALPPADEASARLRVPEGFAVRYFARGLAAPRLMAVGPDGELYVAERGADRIVRLADRDRDGLADGEELVAAGLDGVHSVEWHDGAIYAALNASVVRLRDGNADGDMADAGERSTVTTSIPCCGGHSSRTAHVGPDGKLYVAAGSTGNNNIEGDPRRAAILRFNLDGSIPADNPFATDDDPERRPVWAEGLRNSVDFLFTPGGRLWATHNGSDGLGNDLPPEEIVIDVARGAHHGWPYCYTPQLGAVPAGAGETRDQRVPLDDRLDSCARARPALFTDDAHQAPLGIARYDSAAFPAAYRGSLFVAYHGSWNADQTPRDCRVQRVVVEGGAPVRGEPFLTGFRDSPDQECGNAWGRPAGVTPGSAGELFISDDKRGAVYRVVYVGP